MRVKYLGGLELSPMGSRLRLCCVLATRWVHSCSSSAPEAPDRVCADLHGASAKLLLLFQPKLAWSM